MSSSQKKPIPRSRSLPKRKAAAFSLVELLVVAGCVLILATLAEPNIGNLTIRMNGMKCSQNLRQILQAQYDYAVENPGQGSPVSAGQIALFQSYVPVGFVGVADRCPSDGTLYATNTVYNIYAQPQCPNNAPNNANLASYPYAVDAFAPNYSINGYHNLGHATTNN